MALNVSSRKVTPIPSVPPTCLSVAGVQGFQRPSQRREASRTEMIFPSCARPVTDWSMNASCSGVESATLWRNDFDRSLVRVGLLSGGRKWGGFQGRSRRGAWGSRRSDRRDHTSDGLEKRAKVFRHVFSSAEPLRRPLRERLLADPFQFLGDRVVDLSGRASLSLGHLLDDLTK